MLRLAILSSLALSSLPACGGLTAQSRPASPALAHSLTVPPSASFVAGFSFAEFRKSEHYQSIEGILLSAMQESDSSTTEFLQTLEAGCSLSPQRDLDWGLVVTGDPEERDEVVFVLGGSFSKDQVRECVSKMGWDHQDRGEIRNYEDMDLFVTWPKDNVVAIAFEEDTTGFLLQVANGSSTGPSQALEQAIKDTDTSGVLFFAGNPNRNFSPFEMLDLDRISDDAEPTAQAGAIHAASNFAINFRFRFPASVNLLALATHWKQRFNEELEETPLRFYLETLDVVAEDDGLRVVLELGDKKVASLITMLNDFLVAERKRDAEWEKEWEERERERKIQEEKDRRDKELADQKEKERKAREAAQAAADARARAKAKAEADKLKAKAHSDQGRAFLDAGVYDKAIAEFEAAYRLLPLPDFLYNIGFAYDNQRKKESEALTYYQRYLQKDPHGAMSEVARRRVAKLTKRLRDKKSR